MTVNEIRISLNKLAKEKNCQIASLPELRKQYLNKKVIADDIFTKKSSFENYFFHNGGRTELQFNVGNAKDNFTRCVLAISPIRNNSLTDPYKTFKPYLKRLNNLLENQPNLFNGFKIYYKKSDNEKLIFLKKTQRITNKVFNESSFIGIGNFINKPIKRLNQNDLIFILKTFDELLPIYKYCVF